MLWAKTKKPELNSDFLRLFWLKKTCGAKPTVRSVSYTHLDVYKRQIEQISLKAIDSEYAVDMLMVCKYFERIGDHATNIAEWVIFSISGRHPDEKKNNSL